MLRFAVYCCLIGLLLAGCDRAAPGPATGVNGAAAQVTDKTDPKGPGNPEVKLRLVTYDEIFKEIEAQKGKVVVMDVWATSCQPCREEFHNLVELHNKYPREQLACLSLSLDYYGVGKPEDLVPVVTEFLQEKQATLTNLMSSEDVDVVAKKLDVALPTVFVYDRQGQLRKKFDNRKAKSKAEQFTYADVRKLVAELLAEPAATPAGGEAPAVPAGDSR